ncbi:STAS domain-containing protein [Nocardia sp. X0981]
MNPSSSSSRRFANTRYRSPDGQLTFQSRKHGDIVVLAMRGEADAFTLPLWRRQIREAAGEAAATGGALLIDTTRLDFLSLGTLAALAEDADAWLRDGVVICLVTWDSRVPRFAGADTRTERLLVHSTVSAGLTALQRSARPPSPATRPGPYEMAGVLEARRPDLRRRRAGDTHDDTVGASVR